MKKLLIIGVIFLGTLFSSYAGNAINTTKDKPVFVPDEIIVKYDRSVSQAQKDSMKNKYQMKLKKNSRKSGAFSVYKHGNPTAIMNRLKHELGVVSVQQNAYAYMTAIPNDTYYDPYQWHMPRIGCEAAWDISTGAGAVVAVIDTGVKQSLQDLAGTNFTNGYDFVNSDNDPTDDEGHGSHVTGTIAQTTNNNLGCVGIAYNCTIMPVKVLDKRGSGSFDDIADGIYFAVDNGAHVINMSLGGSSSLDILEDAVNYAWNNGVVVVCAAGNESTSAPSYPGAYTNSISVTATGGNDDLASYSNYGSTVDISAPGGDSGDYNNDGYDDMILQNTFSGTDEGYYFFAGTSMASPHVAGVAALIKSTNPSLTNTQIRAILEDTAEDLGTGGWDQYYGHGLVDAYAAVLAAGGTTPPDENVAPNAAFSFSTDELTATFTDSSSDSDGSVVSWLWNFGDGNTSTAENPVHVYNSDGTYTVVLTVTDNDGATDTVSDSVSVSATPTGDNTMTTLIDNMYVRRAGRNYYCYATVYVFDGTSPLSGATVNVTWSDAVNASASGVTGTDGSFTFMSPKTKTSSGSFTISINGVTYPSYTFDSSNSELSETVSY